MHTPDLDALGMSFVWVMWPLLFYLGPDFSLALLLVGTFPCLADYGAQPLHNHLCLERASRCGFDAQLGNIQEAAYHHILLCIMCISLPNFLREK